MHQTKPPAAPLSRPPAAGGLPGGNRGIVAEARAMRAAGRSFVLALVTRTEGSTYRKAGALALVADDGTQRGAISGGCLESSLRDAAARALAAGEARTLVFDTRDDDDLLFGSGSGCRGRMQVALLPVLRDHEHALFDALAAADADHRPLALGLADDGRIEWPPDTPVASRPHVVVPAPPRLLLIGAGPESAPLIRLARELGWATWVGEHRPQAIATYAADADRSFAVRPRDLAPLLGEVAFDAAIVMTHLASADLEALRLLAARPEPFIGLLGPPARRDELLHELSDEERALLLPRLRAPVGLRLGGDGPDALALSIAAQLQQLVTSSR